MPKYFIGNSGLGVILRFAWRVKGASVWIIRIMPSTRHRKGGVERDEKDEREKSRTRCSSKSRENRIRAKRKE